MRSISITELQIIDEVGRWGVITLQDLAGQLKDSFGYAHIKNTVRSLEKRGLLQGNYIKSRWKHVGLTDKGAVFSRFTKRDDPHNETLTHDLTVSRVMIELLNFSGFKSLDTEARDRDLDPDGVISGVIDESPYRLALEVELTQKSKSRYTTKFFKYSQTKSYDFVLYLSHKEQLLRSYKNELDQMSEEIQEKIILGFSENLMSPGFSYRDIRCRHKCWEGSLVELFREKK